MIVDFNCEIHEKSMSYFCQICDFENLTNDPTCSKKPQNPTCFGLIMTNKPKYFHNSITSETGLSHFHKIQQRF